MDEKIYNLASSLSESLNNEPDVILLNKLEKELNDSYEVYSLSNKKDECLETYTRLKDAYGDDHPEVIEALKALKTAKENLNNHPIVKKYLEVYSRVRNLYMEIDNILFGDFKRGSC